MQKMIVGPAASMPAWEALETFARAQVQGFIQQLLEDEVAELLGRSKSERREAVDAPAGSRNGHGKPRQLALMNGTITVWRGVREGRARHEQGGVARADRRRCRWAEDGARRRERPAGVDGELGRGVARSEAARGALAQAHDRRRPSGDLERLGPGSRVAQNLRPYKTL